MPKKPVCLHIGLAKTGTTAIQKILTVNREALAADGICYPTTGVVGKKLSQADWALDCQKAPTDSYDELTAIRDGFEQETEPFDQVIVSSEGFQNVTDFTRLQYLFRSGDINVVVCLREYLDLVRSTYAQYVQVSQTVETFRDFCTRHAAFDLDAFMARWAEWGDRVTPVKYRNHVAAVFLDAIGVKTKLEDIAADPNPSISGNLLAFKLQLNQHVPHEPLFYNGCLRLALQEPRWRGGFRIGRVEAERFRTEAKAFNKTIADHCGELAMRDFEDGRPLVDPDTWDDDVERILAERVFANVRDNPNLRKLPDITQWFAATE